MPNDPPMTDPRVILLIEDNVSYARLMATLLRQHGHAVNLAHTVDDALTALATSPPAGVILDWRLDRSSTPLLQTLTSMEVPVIVLSGDPDAPEEAKKRGWVYLLKGCEPDDILKAVGTLLASVPTRTLVPAPGSPQEGRDSIPPVGLARTDPAVAIAHYRWRTTRAAVRLVATVCMSGLTFWFSIKGHEPPLWIMAMIAAVAIGWGAAYETFRKNPRAILGVFFGLLGVFAFSVLAETHILTTVTVALGSLLPAVQFAIERRSV